MMKNKVIVENDRDKKSNKYKCFLRNTYCQFHVKLYELFI